MIDIWAAHKGWTSVVAAVGATAARLTKGGITIAALKSRHRKLGIASAPSTLIIIDEIGMCPQNDMEWILKTFRKAVIVWIGDIFQFDPADPKNPKHFFHSGEYKKAMTENKVRCFSLETFWRYTGKYKLEMERFVDGVINQKRGWQQAAVDFLDMASRTRAKSNRKKPGITLMATRRMVQETNKRITTQLAREMGTDPIKLAVTDPKTMQQTEVVLVQGQTVQIKRNQHNAEYTPGKDPLSAMYTIANGEMATLVAVEPVPNGTHNMLAGKKTKAIVETEDGSRITIRAELVEGTKYNLPIRPKGAHTVHSMQGATIGNGTVRINLANMTTFAHLFVAITRVKDPYNQLIIEPFQHYDALATISAVEPWRAQFMRNHRSRVKPL